MAYTRPLARKMLPLRFSLILTVSPLPLQQLSSCPFSPSTVVLSRADPRQAFIQFPPVVNMLSPVIRTVESLQRVRGDRSLLKRELGAQASRFTRRLCVFRAAAGVPLSL